MSAETPRLVVVGGPNGCGKTTFARAYSEQEGLTYLGADDIAARLSPNDPQVARVAAGRVFGQELTRTLENKLSRVIESTLAGGTLSRHIERAKENGYEVTVMFVFLSSPEHCLRRIAERVAHGGHDVPEADVRRRYGRTFSRFWGQYRHLADDWMLVDNSGESFVTVATGEGSDVTVYDEEAWSKFILRAEAKEESERNGERTEE